MTKKRIDAFRRPLIATAIAALLVAGGVYGVRFTSFSS